MQDKAPGYEAAKLNNLSHPVENGCVQDNKEE
jgi:hypothetical protein